MYTIVTQYTDKPVSAYQVEDEDSAIHIARNSLNYEGVLQTTVFIPNLADRNGVGSMMLITRFEHDVPEACEGHGIVQRNGLCTNCEKPV